MNTLAFCLNLMKGIAGTGSLSVPYAFAKVGIIPGICLFALVCCMMVLATYQLIDIHNNMGNRRILGLKSIKTNNVYAEMVYNVLGTTGYRFYVFFSLFTLYGSNVGSLIVMTDFLSAIPFTSGTPQDRRVFSQFVLTIVSLLLCLLKDPSLLVPVSSFGLIAIASGYLIMIIYGMTHYDTAFEPADLWPVSFSEFLSNIGKIVYCMGFILFLLTQYKYIRRDCRRHVIRSTAISISLMAVLYCFIGIVLSQYYKTVGVQDNILNSFPTDGALGVIINLAMMVTVVGGFPLWMEPVNETVEGDDIEHGKIFIKTPKYIMLRTVEVCLMSLIALLIPAFGTVVGLIGNFTDVLTTFTFPAVMHIVFFRNKTSPTITYLDLGQLVLSVVIMIICTSLSLKEFIKS